MTTAQIAKARADWCSLKLEINYRIWRNTPSRVPRLDWSFEWWLR